MGGRGGMKGITLAVSYHHGRDIFPHDPVRKVRFLEGGAVFFRPDASHYRDLAIQPHVSELAGRRDVLAELVEAAARSSLSVNAWTVFLHNSTLGQRHPECAPRNAFGDPYLTDLCPAHPEVRAYAVALSADIARYGVNAIVAESLHYHPLEHGFHHERYFLDLGPLARYLLGLCFCDHCLEAARERGVDAEGVRRLVRERLERVFGGEQPQDPGEVTLEGVGSLAGGEMAGYLEARRETVTSLVAEATGAVAGTGVRFTFMDLSGAAKGYATGRPEGDPAPLIAWKLGVELAGIAAVAHLEAIGYAADPDRLRLDLTAYRALLGGDATLASAMRPMLPDCDSAENLAAKLVVARELGLARVDFYHYGFMPLPILDRIRAALELASA